MPLNGGDGWKVVHVVNTAVAQQRPNSGVVRPQTSSLGNNPRTSPPIVLIHEQATEYCTENRDHWDVGHDRRIIIPMRAATNTYFGRNRPLHRLTSVTSLNPNSIADGNINIMVHRHSLLW